MDGFFNNKLTDGFFNNKLTDWRNGYRNKSQHRKFTLEILPPPLPGLEPEIFRSRVLSPILSCSD